MPPSTLTAFLGGSGSHSIRPKIRHSAVLQRERKEVINCVWCSLLETMKRESMDFIDCNRYSCMNLVADQAIFLALEESGQGEIHVLSVAQWV